MISRDAIAMVAKCAQIAALFETLESVVFLGSSSLCVGTHRGHASMTIDPTDPENRCDPEAKRLRVQIVSARSQHRNCCSDPAFIEGFCGGAQHALFGVPMVRGRIARSQLNLLSLKDLSADARAHRSAQDAHVNAYALPTPPASSVQRPPLRAAPEYRTKIMALTVGEFLRWRTGLR
jgi:hypothetical protein